MSKDEIQRLKQTAGGQFFSLEHFGAFWSVLFVFSEFVSHFALRISSFWHAV